MIVAGLEGPARETGEIREHHRHVQLAATAALRLGQCLPELQRSQAQLAHHARSSASSLGEMPDGQVGGPAACR